jgi:Ca2+-binding RTX toxin-like protein
MKPAPIESLESRRLLSLALTGLPTEVPGAANAGTFDFAVAANGDAIVAFTNASDQCLRAVRYDADGTPLGSPITVVSGKTFNGVSVSIDPDGDAVVAWGEQPFNSTQSVHFDLISRTGVVGSPVTVATDTFAGGPAVSMDASGGFFLTWYQSPTRDIDAKVQAFDASGSSHAAAFVVTSGNISSLIDDVHIAAKSDGSGAIFAVHGSYEGAGDDIRIVQVTTTAPVGQLNAIPVQRNVADPNIALHADGSFDVAFTTFDNLGGIGGDPTNAAVRVQRYHSDATPNGDMIIVSPPSGFVDSLLDSVGDDCSIAAMSDGGFIVSYEQVPNAGPTAVFVQRYDAAGAADADGPLQIAPNGLSVISADAGGNAIVAFADSRTSTPLSLARLSSTAPFASVTDGLLLVSGAAGDDAISIDVAGSNLAVTRNGDILNFSAAAVSSIHVEGFAGNDTISNNTAIKSTLEGGDGNDTLFGGAGADRLDGGAGSDSLWGDNGNDRLAGDEGHDYLFGGGGNDKIYGGLQPDFIRGNAGRDKLYGNGGNDIIYGGASADSLYGQGGNDQLFGEGGNDRLYCDYASGNSTLHGGAGDDIFASQNGLSDHLFGDGGHDSATADIIDTLSSIEG